MTSTTGAKPLSLSRSHAAPMPEEVSNPFGLSGQAGEDPAMVAASWQGQDLKDKWAVDVNGQRLGKVVRAFAEEGTLTRFDVKLSNQARQIFDAGEQDVAGVPADAIARIEGDEVRLMQAAEQILHPEHPDPAHANPDSRGAQELPRKNR